jgi:hypothetical protein
MNVAGVSKSNITPQKRTDNKSKNGGVPDATVASAAAPSAPAAAAAATPGVRIAFPSSLTPRQRAALHAAAEAFGVPHASAGEGADRCIALGPEGAAACVDAGAAAGGPLSDEALCALLQQHLSIDAAPHFAAAPAAGGGGRGAGTGAAAAARAAAKAAGFGAGDRGALVKAPLSLEEFVERTGRLLELEREADIAQATEATSLVSPERAQVGHAWAWGWEADGRWAKGRGESRCERVQSKRLVRYECARGKELG